MRWRDAFAAIAGAVVCGAIASHAALAGDRAPDVDSLAPVTAALEHRLAILDRTEGMVADKLTARRDDLKRRVRATYKLLRAGWAPAWINGDRSGDTARIRANARKILARDLDELELLKQEMRVLDDARAHIERERRQAAAIEPPAPGSLRIPVAFSRVVGAFGHYRHGPSRVRMTRRGIELSSRPGRNVRAVADGEVRYAGPVRGLGHVAIVDHGDFVTVSGRLTAGAVTTGSRVAVGDILGESVGDTVYFETRLDIGAGGFPVDPTPLIAW